MVVAVARCVLVIVVMTLAGGVVVTFVSGLNGSGS